MSAPYTRLRLIQGCDLYTVIYGSRAIIVAPRNLNVTAISPPCPLT